MKRIVCANCGGASLIRLNPDEDQCKSCGKILEKLSDYKRVDAEEEQ
jgi:DNA-directed RNA polymerase subunit RPC12/RpoP